MVIRFLVLSGCCFALILLFSCRRDILSPNTITSIEYTISGGLIGRQTTLSITPLQQSLTTNVRFSADSSRRGACAVDGAITPQAWQSLTGTYNDTAFRNVPKSTLPTCCDLIYTTVIVKAGGITRQAEASPRIQSFVDALNTQLASLEDRCP